MFPDLFAGAGETYSVSVLSPATYVDPNELFYNSPAAAVPVWTSVQPLGQPSDRRLQPQSHPGARRHDERGLPDGNRGRKREHDDQQPFGDGRFGRILTSHRGGHERLGPRASLPARPSRVLQANTLTLSANATATATGTATLTFSAPFASTVNPAPVLPISVQSSTLLCSSIAPETCVLGNPSGTGTNSFSSTTAQPALLYPGPLVTDPQIAGVTTTSGTASVTVASGGFPGVTVGMPVTGTGIASGTIVSMISGNTLDALGQCDGEPGPTTLTFLPPNYSAWAGDQADSAPSYNSDYMAGSRRRDELPGRGSVVERDA